MTFQDYRSRTYFPELDGLRAISILLVLSVHIRDQAFGFLAGYLGVVLFFILSGYLITTLALREEEAQGRLSLSGFYLRRTFRIFPLYYLTLGTYAVLLLGLGLRPEQGTFLKEHALAYLFYFSEVPIFGSYYEAIPFIQSWSLGIEEKFYLVWPLLAFVVLRGKRNGRFVVAGVLALGFAMTPLLGQFGYEQLAACLNPYFHIAMGCVLALVLHDPRGYARLGFLSSPVVAWGLLGLLLGIHASMPVFSHHGYGTLGQTIYCVLATLVIGTMLRGAGPLPVFLSYRPLRFVGTLAYGMYLNHLFVLYVSQRFAAWVASGYVEAILALVLTTIGSIGVAYGTAILVERPCIRLGRSLARSWRHDRPASRN